jgi:hypothetical protein
LSHGDKDFGQDDWRDLGACRDGGRPVKAILDQTDNVRAPGDRGPLLVSGRKVFFSEEKKQKTFILWCRTTPEKRARR